MNIINTDYLEFTSTFHALVSIDKALSAEKENPHSMLTFVPGFNYREKLRNYADKVRREYTPERLDQFMRFFGGGLNHRIDAIYQKIMKKENPEERDLRYARLCGWVGDNAELARHFLDFFERDINDLVEKKIVKGDPRFYLPLEQKRLDFKRTLHELRKSSIGNLAREKITEAITRGINENDYTRVRRGCLLLDFQYTYEGDSVLHTSIKYGKLNVALKLIKEYPNTYANTPQTILLAYNGGHFTIVEELMKKGATLFYGLDLFLFFGQSTKSTPFLTRELARRKYFFHQKNPEGRNFIGVAAMVGNLENVKALELHGMKIHSVDNNNNSVLMLGIKHVEVVKYVLNQTQHIEHRNKMGETAFLCAAESPPEVLRLLILAGADTNARYKDGKHILHRLIATENIVNMVCLVNETDLDARDKNFLTPLMAVAAQAWNDPLKCAAAAEALLNAGCDVELVNAAGSTAYQIAKNTNNLPAMVEIAKFTEKLKIL